MTLPRARPYQIDNDQTWTGEQTFEDINATGGQINGTSIGDVTPGTGAFTTLAATSLEIGGEEVSFLELLDEDDFTSDSATKPPSQQSAKAYITTYVAAQIDALLDSPPGALDTLNELAAALGDDANFASTVTTALAGKLAKSGGQLTGALDGNDQTLSKIKLIDSALTYNDLGNSGTTTQDLDYEVGSHQRIAATDDFEITTSNWPPTGNLGILLLEAVDFGAHSITLPTINWVMPDGTTTTTFATWLAAQTGRTALQTSGTDFFILRTRDAGTTIYGNFAA